MTIRSKNELRVQLKSGEIARTYLLFGAENYQRDLAVKTIADLVLKDAELREFNESDFRLSETELASALAAAEQFPMMATRRVIKIRELNKLKEADEDILTKYLTNPSDFTVLIFIADDLDKRTKTAKLLLENCYAVEFPELKVGECVSFVNDRFRELEIKTDPSVAQQLVGLTGNDLQKITNEIEKLAVASLPEKVITTELVENLVANTGEISNFEISDALLKGNRLHSLKTLKKLLDDGVEPLMLLGLIAGHYHRLFLAKDMMRSGVDRKEVARAINLPYFKQEDFLASARREETEKLVWKLRRIFDADLAIKTSQATPRLQIEMLVAELI